MIKTNIHIYKLVLFICYLLYINGKQIEDPVARHDANMCGTYLCPGLPDLASKYIQSGCEKEFREFLNEEIKSTGKEQILELNTIETENDGLTKMVLIIMAIFSGLLSSTCGYYVGIWERKNVKKVTIGIDEF